MNWDWEKLQEKRQRQDGGPPPGPDFKEINDRIKQFKVLKPGSGGAKIILLILVLLWAASGIYIVQPDEVGVVQRFGAFNRTTGPGPHYHLPFPVESVQTPRVTEIQRIEVGFRSRGRGGTFDQGNIRLVPEEALMLTGDENIVDVQFIVQFQIKDPKNYLFNVADPLGTVRDAAESAMREVIGKNKIDSALTTGKLEIQVQTMTLLQQIMDRYKAGLRIVAVQLQNVHPPNEVVDAFKDVASAREDKSRFINEADAYRNDLIPKARGQAAVVINDAQAYKESAILEAKGDATRFKDVLKEYIKAPTITRKRMYLEAMEEILSDPLVEKIILSDEAMRRALPYLPLDRLGKTRAATGKGGK
jgi:membrane protease subunit HflK